MDIRKIKTLIEMLEESNLNEIEVSQGDESVRISKGKNSVDLIENNQINTGISNQEKVSIKEDNTKELVGKGEQLMADNKELYTYYCGTKEMCLATVFIEFGRDFEVCIFFIYLFYKLKY